jgi:integrase
MKGDISKRTVDALKPQGKEYLLWDSDLRGFGVKVTPEGRKVYLIQYRMGGRGFPTRRFTIGTHGQITPDLARATARKRLEDVDQGIDPMVEKKRDKADTVAQLIKDFVKSRQMKGQRSINETERLLNREVLPKWRTRSVASITKGDVVRLIDGIANRGAGTLANRALAHLKTMFNWAADRDTIKDSPCKGIDAPHREVSRERAHTDAELAEIWQAANAIGYPFGHAVKMLILTGQRREEVGGMLGSELDLDAGLWTLPGERTKNGKAHDIHLSALAVEVVKSVPRKKGVDLLFSTTGDTPVSGWSKAKTAIDAKILQARIEAAAKAGETPESVKPMEHWTFHDLRRTFATGLNNLRVLPHVADRILNHVSKKKGGVMAVYNRAEYWEERKAAMTLWADHVQALTRSATKTCDNTEGGANS